MNYNLVQVFTYMSEEFIHDNLCESCTGCDIGDSVTLKDGRVGTVMQHSIKGFEVKLYVKFPEAGDEPTQAHLPFKELSRSEQSVLGLLFNDLLCEQRADIVSITLYGTDIIINLSNGLAVGMSTVDGTPTVYSSVNN